MSAVAVGEMASFARDVSVEKLKNTYQETQMSSLKQSVEVQEKIQLQIIAMMRELFPHLGSNLDVSA